MSNHIADTILSMASQRGPDKTICPSDVAREMFPVDWHRHMDEIRKEAISLYRSDKIYITQKGIPINPDDFKGPIRIKIVAG